MADSVNLPGVIGTWVAGFLALVILASILPAILIYKASKKSQAPSNSYRSSITFTNPAHTNEEEYHGLHRVQAGYPPKYRRASRQPDGEEGKEGPEPATTDEEDIRRESEVLRLARRLTPRSWFSGCTDNPFYASSNSKLNPRSKNFSAKAWAKAMLNIHLGDPKAYPLRTVGLAFQNLNVLGYGVSTDYQKDVFNVWLEAWGFVQKTLRINRRRIDILRDFEGVVNAGEMLVVLGPPGSGCSTLLKTIAGETDGLTVDPKSSLNYKGINAKQMHKDFRGESLYTADADVHFPMLSVGDTLTFAARARLPRHVPGGVTKIAFAEHIRDVVMTMFGISHTLNTPVGNEFIRGVSGGERKRVTIAEATLSGAPLQCWDNSTRGLDSANAIEFCRTLRTQTEISGSTACVAIYQSPQVIYDLFDKVIVIYEGRQIYFGPVAEAQEYFEDMGFECPARQTTPDFLTSMTSPYERIVREGWENRVPRTADEFAQRWKESQERKKLVVEIDEFNRRYSIGGKHLQKFQKSRRAQQAYFQRVESPYTLSYAQQVKLCLWRGFQRLKGDPSILFLQLIGNFITALIIGSVFYNLQPNTSSFFQRGVVIFFAVLINAFSSALEILTLYAQRRIIEKHQRYAFYHPSAEAFASMLTDMPYKIGNAIIFNIILYFMVNLRREPGPLFFFLLISFFLTLNMSMLFRMMASVSRTLSQALAPATVVILAIITFTGFAIPIQYMPTWCRWIRYINPVAYGFESLIINEFHDRNFTCSTLVPSGAGGFYDDINSNQHVCAAVGSTPGSNIVNGDTYINSAFEYHHAHKWWNFGVTIGFMILFMIAYLISAELVQGKKSKGEVLVFQRGYVPVTIAKKSPHDIEAVTKGLAVVAGQIMKDEREAQTIQRQTTIFHWEDVCYDIKIKGNHRRILDNVDGWVKPGTLTALMGVSGAGKTTLLDVLATRVTIGVVTGEMLVDGHLRDQSFQRKIGYVQQQDLHLPTSTVREALRFSALLRQSGHVPQEEKLAYVDEVIKVLEMDDFADAVVGVPGEGLNVEQRKRLTIGVELAAKPELLFFLDEPTSGLDSQTSWAILDLLEKLAKNGQAIFCTIHQPSAMLFQRFDRVLLLKSGGQTVYFGDIGENSSTLISYFERHGALPCPENANPAEWMLETIGDAPGHHTDLDWFSIWRNSVEYTEVKRELHQFKQICPLETKAREAVKDQTSYQEFAAPFWLQMQEVQKRVFQQYWRTPSYIYSKTVLCVSSALFIGFSFFKAPLTQQGLQNQMFAIFTLLTIFGQLVQQIMPGFIAQRDLYEVRERPAKTYSWKAFMLSNIIVELPYQTLMSVIMFFCWYYPVGMYRNAIPTNTVHERGFLMFLLIFGYLIFTSTFSHMVVAAAKDAETASNTANMMSSFSLIFCGILAGPKTLPGFWIFMYRVSPFTYIVSTVMSTGLANADVTCASNEYLAFDPQPNMTCLEYMLPYIAADGGYLQNPNAMSNCSFCTTSSTNTFLESINSSYNTVWRDFGILWAYVLFNVVMALFLYWLFRVPDKFGRKRG